MVIPILRGNQSPEDIARGVAVGIAAGMTPLVGAQLPVFFVLGSGSTIILSLGFLSTDVTNVFTLPFFYYAFLVTGRIMLGRWDRVRDFETFSGRLGKVSPSDSGWMTVLVSCLTGLFVEFGWPMFIGCLSLAIIGSWLGYW